MPDGDRLVATTQDGQALFADPRTASPVEPTLSAGSVYLSGVAV